MDLIKLDQKIRQGTSFSIREIFSKGAGLFHSQPVFVLAYYLMTLVLSLIGSIVLGSFSFLWSILVIYPISAGIYLGINAISRKEEATFQEAFKIIKFYGPILLQYLIILAIFMVLMVVCFILLGLVGFGYFQELREFVDPASATYLVFTDQIKTVMAYMSLCFIPFIYLSIIVSFAQFFLIFGGLAPWDAIVWSQRLVHSVFWKFLLFLLVLALLNLAGALFLLIGLLYTLPLTMCVFYALFEDLVEVPGEEEPVEMAALD
ncbi:hypothetical protein [Penaeicola halotolerans]|uniref:hypothetical protein n=1 Tax=Penaeicola halotolerans TaxID=2793196 RepID=UPI001CF8101A|nr:hypothetical protein [Penaeicola halotolerans]